MSEKTLLVEIEKEQKEMVEKKFAQEKERREEEKKEADLKEGKFQNLFSSASFPESEKQNSSVMQEKQIAQERLEEENQTAKIESKVSQVIETPNYDLTEGLSEQEQEKIFKIEKEESKKPKVKFGRMKWILLSILFAIFGVWGIVNISTLDSLGSQIASVEYTYSIKLGKYLSNLAKLDLTSSENMQNLLPTIPDQKLDPTEIGAQSNWFDRICNFLGGLFGG